MNKYIVGLSLIFALLGLADASYLTYEHFSGNIPPCSYSQFPLVDCGTVLKSSYAVILGVPVALLGVIHYALLISFILFTAFTSLRIPRMLAVLQSNLGFLFSLFFVFIQLFILHSICIYCMASALISTILFFLVVFGWPQARKELVVFFISYSYRYLIKPILFKFDPETVHEFMTSKGFHLGRLPLINFLISFLVKSPLPSLEQKIKKIQFNYPIGLSAGFDYEANLTQTLAPWGFGFQTVGTITNLPYEGNTKPRLARLPKSKSLLVNKGFKNPGAEAIINKLSPINFPIPVGISIGRTNSQQLNTQEQSVADIIQAFQQFELSKVQHSFYELNISCPNLHGDVEFYSLKNLRQLLEIVDKLKLKHSVFVKMPIDKSEAETLAMLKIISEHKISGVIFGNLQKNRQHPSFHPQEISQFQDHKGHFSGKPTYDQSNQLIKLAYKHYHKQLIIIGCGGVFSAQDAYQKIKNGASLVQLITGMIYQGPQVVMEINFGLQELLSKDGYTHISQVIGKAVK